MREIKFRGRPHKPSHQVPDWIVGDLLHEGTCPDDDEYAILYYDEEDGWLSDKVINKTIGQFTGLHDKNGREIYEGDILKDNKGRLYEVKYDDGCFVVTNAEMEDILLVVFCMDFPSKVIGNIHNDPKLNKK